MSLKFLYKKGFHTARLDIQDKVWQAEQKRDEEARKTAELRRQIEDERAVQDLRAQMGGGNVNGASTDTGLEWMYAGVRKSVAEKQDESEAFLTGKKAVGESEGKVAKVAPGVDFDANKLSSKRFTAITGGRVAAVEALAKIDDDGIKSTSSLSSSLFVSNKVPRAEAFAVRQADPLVAMAEAEARRKQLLLSDPRVLEKIKEKLLSEQKQKQVQVQTIQQQSFSEQLDQNISGQDIMERVKEKKSTDVTNEEENEETEHRHKHRRHHRHHHHRRSDNKDDEEDLSHHRRHHHRRRHRDNDEMSPSHDVINEEKNENENYSRKRLREETCVKEDESLIETKDSAQQSRRTRKSRWDIPEESTNVIHAENITATNVIGVSELKETLTMDANIETASSRIYDEIKEREKETEKEEDIDENLETIEGRNLTIKASTNTVQFGLIGGAKKKEGMNHLGIPEHIAKEREALFRAKQLETFRGGKGGRREHR
jgi:hypothetical protein